MNRLYWILFCLVSASSFAQVPFWTENFNNGCPNNCPATTYAGANGAWTQTITGAEGADPNQWFVSQAENNNGIGVCTSASGANATLHISADPGSIVCPNDCGAAYDAGGLCPILSCPQTDRRIESPTINCTGQTTITLGFSYIYEGALGNDFVEVWYFDGGAWAVIGTPGQTANGGCAAGGLMTAFTVALPASANNNANVKIGFRWVNNDDGAGTDPSVAIDDVTLATTTAAVPVVTVTVPASICTSTATALSASATNGPITGWAWTSTPAAGVTFAPGASSQNPTITITTPGTYTISCVATNASGNSAPATQVVTVTTCVGSPTPSITASGLTTCVNSPLTLSGSATGGAVSTWAWSSNPSTNVNFSAATNQNTAVTFGSAGSHTITLTVTPGGATATVTITVNPLPNVSVTAASDTICKGASGTTLTATGNAAGYTWAPSSGLSGTVGASVVANPTVTTQYIVTGTLSGCVNKDTIIVTVLNIDTIVATAASYYVCQGNSTTLSANVSGNVTSYTWSPNNNLSSTVGSTVTTTPADTIVYTVTVTGNCLFNTTDTVQIFVVQCGPPQPGFTASTHTVCRTNCISYTDTSKYPPLQYLWVFQGGVPDSSTDQNPTVCYNIESSNSPNGNGMYYVTLYVTNLLGQIDSIKDSVTVLPSPIADINNGAVSVTIDQGDQVTLDAQSYTSGAIAYNWTPITDLTNPGIGITVADPLVNTTYVVQAFNALGCYDYDTIIVRVKLKCGEVFIPNAFSPNGDGSNDFLQVRTNSCISSMNFAIFDRWGEKVFESADPNQKWDGSYKGSALNTGVFVYYFDALLKDNTTVSKKGNITLIR